MKTYINLVGENGRLFASRWVGNQPRESGRVVSTGEAQAIIDAYCASNNGIKRGQTDLSKRGRFELSFEM